MTITIRDLARPKSSRSRSPRRLLSAAVAAALAGSLVVTVPAGAATTEAAFAIPATAAASAAAAAVVQVGIDDIAADDTVYAGWHQGAQSADGFGLFDITTDGLGFYGRSQVIRGYDDNAKNVDARNVSSLMTVLPATTFTVTAGAPVLQVPIFFTSNGSSVVKFATLRPATPSVPGVNEVALDDQWISSATINDDLPKNTALPLESLLGGLDRYKVIGFGLYSEGGYSAASEITWDGTTYEFAQAPVEPQTVRDTDVRGNEDIYAGWHQGASTPAYDATYAQQVTQDGLELAGTSQVINGYANNSSTLDVLNARLPFAVRQAEFTVESGTVTFQIPLFFQDGAETRFATLRTATEQGPGKHDIALDDQWISNKTLPGIPANQPAPLNEVIAALGTYKVIAFGVYAADGVDAVVSNVTWQGTSYTFAEPEQVVTPVLESEIASSPDIITGWHQGGAGGNQVRSDGLNLTGTSQVIKGYADHALQLGARNVDLVSALRSATWSVESGDVWLQVPLYARVAGPTGNANGFTTLRPAVKSVVGTNTVDVDQDWISSRAVGNWAANTPVPLRDLLKDLRDYKVLAFGVFSQDVTGVVTDLVWDDVAYTFVNAAPTASDVSGSTRAGDPVTVALRGADADGNALVYSATGADGTATVTGSSLKFTPAAGFDGVATFPYTVSDERGGTATADVTITVAKNQAPSAPTLTASTNSGKAVTVTLRSTDAEKDAITYRVGAVTGGTVKLVGSKVTFTPKPRFGGAATVAYSATDSRGARTTGTIKITINKVVTSTAVRVAPKAPTTRSSVVVTTTVTFAAGAAVEFGRYTVTVDKKLIRRVIMVAKGSSAIRLPGTLKKGKHTIAVVFEGTATTKASSKTITITVK